MTAVLDLYPHLGSRIPEPIGALHARLSNPLKRFFRGYRLNPADVDDLTQDVFVRLMGSDDRTVLRTPEAFVFTLARNLVRDRVRRLHTKAGARSVSLEDVDLSCDRPTPDQCLDLSQRLAQVERVLGSLNPRTREAFTLHRVHGESYSAIAAHMAISVSMVEKHLMSATLALRTVHDQ